MEIPYRIKKPEAIKLEKIHKNKTTTAKNKQTKERFSIYRPKQPSKKNNKK